MFGIVVVLLFRVNYLIISTFQNGRILFAAAFVAITCSENNPKKASANSETSKDCRKLEI